jgi:rod shape determining protein RodA
MQLQPSELMKLAVIMVLSRYFHSATPEDSKRMTFLIIPVIIILMPTGLVLLQPNLGTAIMIIAGGGGMLFYAGAPLWIFLTGIGAAGAAVPVIWSLMHDYQKRRVETFLNPEADPLGAGYNIIQSKIAIGSGGFTGKGFLQGSQSHLNFLPEKHTDFIFTLWVEEWGLIGGIFLFMVFAMIFAYGIWIGLRCRNNFGRYLAVGLTLNFSLYIFINTAMVMGLIPVVGIPLPLISYGGSVMLAAMIGFGLIMACSMSHDSRMGRG